MWRPSTWCLSLVVLLLASGANASPLLYTISAPVAFSNLGVSGTVHPVSAADAAMFDFTGDGLEAGAVPGDFVCDNTNRPFPGFACGFQDQGTSDDILTYSVTLDASSAAASGIAPFFTGTVNSPTQWAGFIFGDGSTHDPDGEIFIIGGRGVVFRDPADSSDTSFYLQPGESSSVLLTAYATSPGLAADLAGGAMLNFRIFRDPFGNQFDLGPVDVVLVPEPAVMPLLSLGLLAMVFKARARE